jgi:DNA mismatch repair protein MutS
MYDTYIRHYKHYAAQYGQNTAIFLLVGSFYELYDIHEKGEGQTSFDRAATIMGIQKVPKGENLWCAGFKDTSLHKFATMLTRENWTVVVIDQVKDAKGSVSSRDVARILSPGTHIENTGADSFYTAGLWLQAEWQNPSPLRFAAAAIDLTTGAVHTYEGEATGRSEWSSDSLLHFFQVHQPKELVVWWSGHALDQPTEIFLRRTLGIPTALIHVRPAEQGALEKPVVREDLLRRSFKPKSLLPLRSVLGIAELPLTERALTSLLLFVEDHYSAAMDMLRLPTAWSPENSVYLGNHALTQLNMITSREEDSVLGMFMKTYTPMGRRAMRRRLLYPITQPKVLETLYSEIAWCLESTTKESVLGNLRQIADLSRLHRRLTVSTVNAVDVTSLDMSYTYSTRILADMGDGPLSTFRAHSDRLSEYRDNFYTVFDIQKALKPQDDMFCLTAAAGPKTAAVEAEIAAARAQIETIHRELYNWVGVEKEMFRLEEKEASIVVAANRTIIKETERAIKAGAPPPSLKGLQVHAKKSSSSLEIPGINAQYTKILGLRLRLAAAVKEELPAACDALTPYTDLWDELEAWVSKVDMSFTISRVSKERGFVRPELVTAAAACIDIKGLRHPLIEAQQTRVEYVKHDVELINKPGAATGWLVYGMNASGKSSLMKAVGIATILAQTGCFVPATSFRYTPFRSLFTRILNTDNLWAGLSSFAVEMTELAEILRRADPRSLVLGDEVCSGTESMSAMSLVGASLEHLSKRGARFIFATHLHGLQEIPAVASLPLKVWHLQVRFDPKTQRLTYDRTLHQGAGSSLYGLEVAKAMAIPFEVLESAHSIRKALVGTATEQEAPLSDWNSVVQRRTCSVCGSEKVRDLEAHHIEARATATSGRLADGSNMNDMRNLTVLCAICHDKVHAKTLEVGPTKQTSEGPVLDVKELSAFAYKPKSDLTEEQLTLIKNDIRNYRTLTPARLIFYIEQHHGIKLTLQRLKTIRASL